MKNKNLHIVINCLGLPFNGETLASGKSLGGSESAAYYVAKELASHGHRVLVFSNTDAPGEFDGVTYLSAGQQTEHSPLGAEFEFYAQNTPHDVCIIQRHPAAFAKKYASKINLLWLHDLALHRHAGAINSCLWNIDGVLCVSEYHKQQVCKVYNLPEGVVHVLPNGVDAEAVEAAQGVSADNFPVDRYKRLMYISRPERGLDRLLCDGGIMEKLPDHHLYICTYNNVTEQMAPYYETLWRKADAMPNVHNLGFLSKDELYSYMKSMGLLVYPTPGMAQPNFREVSCIAAMEAMHAGLPMLTTNAGALPETTNDTGTLYAEPENFVAAIKAMTPEKMELLSAQQRSAAPRYTWEKSVAAFYRILDALVDSNHGGEATTLKHLIRHSAISSIPVTGDLADLPRRGDSALESGNAIYKALVGEVADCYEFARYESYHDHYSKYYDYEADRGVDYGPEELAGNPRFECVSDLIGSREHQHVIDYGCAHGHYTINLARRFPDVKFTGVDINLSNVEKARRWVADEELENVEFICAEYDLATNALKNHENDEAVVIPASVDGLIAAEVLEHVKRPIEIISGLSKYVSEGGAVYVTTPYGPWEAMGYKEHWPFRAHVHNFTRRAVDEIYGSLEGFKIFCVPSGHTPQSEVIGSYVYTYTKREGEAPKQSPALIGQRFNELEEYAAPQTLALAMILKENAGELHRCLGSCAGVLDELVIGFDRTGKNAEAIRVAERFAERERIPFTAIHIDSPVESGFDIARNRVIEKVAADWVLWLDSDEELTHGHNIAKYLTNNSYCSYSVAQNHFSVEPAGVIRTDYPNKLFRARQGIQFFGHVHEHPEKALNGGVGPVFVLPDVLITHYGYDTEDTRRKRFERNFDLLVRDRKAYPERTIGKFFWLRDMSQGCQFLAEKGQANSPQFENFLLSGLDAWEVLLETQNLRFIVEGAKFYSELVKMSGRPFIEIDYGLHFAAEGGTGEQVVKKACFLSKEDALDFIGLITTTKLSAIPTEDI